MRIICIANDAAMIATVSHRLAILLAALSLSAAVLPAAAETLVVYSARNEQLIKPVFEVELEPGEAARHALAATHLLLTRMSSWIP